MVRKWAIFGIFVIMISAVYGSSPSKFWTFEVEGKNLVSVDDDGDYMVVGDEDGNIYFYDKNGDLKWKNKIDGKVDAICHEGGIVGVGSGKKVYTFYDDGDKIDEFFIKDGNILHIRNMDWYNYTITIVGTDSGYVYYYKNDDLEWKYKTNGKITYLTEYNLIYFSSEDGRVYALSYDGSKEWDFKCNGTPIMSVYRPSSSYEDYVAVGGDEKVYLLKSYKEKHSGDYKYNVSWSESVDNPIVKISASENGDYILASDNKNKLYCFDAGDGDKKWTIQLNETVVDIDAGEGILFAVATNSSLYLIDNSGKILKTLQIVGTDVSVPEEDGEYVAVIDKHDSLYYIHKNGEILWSHDLKPKFDRLYVGNNYSIATVWVDVNNNSVYDDIDELSYIYLFDNKNGFTSKDWIYTKIASIDVFNDKYAIAGEDGTISLYGLNNGLIWTYKEKKGAYSVKIVGNKIFAGGFNKIDVFNNNGTKIEGYDIEGSPKSMDYYNGTLIVGCDNGNIYLLKDNNIQLYKKVNNLKKVYLSNKPVIWGDNLYMGDKIIVDNPITVDANKNLIVVETGGNKLMEYNLDGKKLWELNIKVKKVSVSNNDVISAIDDDNNLYLIYNGKIISKTPIKKANNLMISPSGEFVGVGDNYVSMYDTGLRFASINSTPEDAIVKINNKVVGNTPLTIPLFVGKYNITLEKDGYEPLSESILINKSNNFKYILQKILNPANKENNKNKRNIQHIIIINKLPTTINVPGIYSINKSFWDLNNTAITINADNVTILGNFNVIDGIGKGVSIVCRGYNISIKDLILSDWDKDILGNVKNATINNVKVIKDTNYISYNDILNNKLKGEVSIAPEPSAILYINDKFYGETPKEIMLKPGTYNIKLLKVGYAPYIETVKVKKGIKKFIAVKLNKELPTLENFKNKPELKIEISSDNISMNGYTNIKLQIKNPKENKLKAITEVILKSDIPVVDGAESGSGGVYDSKVELSPGESKTLNYKIKGTKTGNHTISIVAYSFPEGNKSIYTSTNRNIIIHVNEPKPEEENGSFIDYLLNMINWR